MNLSDHPVAVAWRKVNILIINIIQYISDYLFLCFLEGFAHKAISCRDRLSRGSAACDACSSIAIHRSSLRISRNDIRFPAPSSRADSVGYRCGNGHFLICLSLCIRIIVACITSIHPIHWWYFFTWERGSVGLVCRIGVCWIVPFHVFRKHLSYSFGVIKELRASIVICLCILHHSFDVAFNFRRCLVSSALYLGLQGTVSCFDRAYLRWRRRLTSTIRILIGMTISS